MLHYVACCIVLHHISIAQDVQVHVLPFKETASDIAYCWPEGASFSNACRCWQRQDIPPVWECITAALAHHAPAEACTVAMHGIQRVQ
jgi:hypothetical protein